MQSRTLMQATVGTVMTVLTRAFQTLGPGHSPMNRTHGLQHAVSAVALSVVGLGSLAHPALAAEPGQPGHRMQRFLTRGPQAVPSGDQTPTAGAQYGLFGCQVAGVSTSGSMDRRSDTARTRGWSRSSALRST
jgi:hypothetical protein